MKRLLTNRTAGWMGALVVVATVAVFSATVTLASVRTTSATIVTNGGARQWIAFVPVGREAGLNQRVRLIELANASSVPNAFTVTFEPTHIPICAGTLAPGSIRSCYIGGDVNLSSEGYFQVVAAQNVLMGGDVEVAVYPYTTSGSHPVATDGVLGQWEKIQLTWQQGCPPRPGSGCPTAATTTVGGTGTTGSVAG